MTWGFIVVVAAFVVAVLVRDARDPRRRALALRFTHNWRAVAVGALVSVVILAVGFLTGTVLGSATECLFGGLIAAAAYDRARPAHKGS